MNRNPTTAHEPATVTLIMPAKNEEAAILRTLDSLPVSTLTTMGFATDVLVLDGRSTDATATIAREWGADVAYDPEPGKGNALRHGRGRVRGTFAIMLDADGTYAPDAIPRLLDPLARDEADVAMGVRLPQPGAMTAMNSLGNRALSLLARILYGRPCPDVCTGLWGFRTDVLKTLPLQSRGFGLEAELFAISCRLNLRIAETPVDYLPRQGEAKLRPFRDGARIFRRLMRSRLMPMPTPLVHPTSAVAAPLSEPEVRA